MLPAVHELLEEMPPVAQATVIDVHPAWLCRMLCISMRLIRGPAGLHVTYPRDRRRILGDDAALRRFSSPDAEAAALSPELERLRSADSSSPDQEVGSRSGFRVRIRMGLRVRLGLRCVLPGS